MSDVSNYETLVESFRGATSALVMIPNDAPNQEQAADALAKAIAQSDVSHVVCLSSLGADKDRRVGPISGLRRLEGNLNQLNVNVLILRPAYFMENHLKQIPLIRRTKAMLGLFRPDMPVAQIAAQDIADYAARALLSCDFIGKITRELLGQRDITMREAVQVIGEAIGDPIHYVTLPAGLVQSHITSLGFSKRQALSTVEMFGSANDGWLVPEEPRSSENTTGTSFERFVEKVFVPQYCT